MKITDMNIDDLKPAPYNPRIKLEPGMTEYDKLYRSIETFGLVEPIIFNTETGYVVGGHQRLAIAKEMGFKKIPTVMVTLSPAEEKVLNAALNKISGEWDMPKLKEFFLDLENESIDATLSGFDEYEIDDILREINAEIDASEKNPPEKVQRTRPGETWQLGFHRLTVGERWEECDMLINRWEEHTALEARRL